MADLQDPTNKPKKKHKVIHWNPEEEEFGAPSKPGLSAYLGGAALMLLIVALAAGAYFLFIHKPAEDQIANGTLPGLSADDPVRAFESVSRAQGIKQSVERKLAAASQMPANDSEVLRQKLINIQKEKIEADEQMERSRYARAIARYTAVDELIENFVTEVENKQKAQLLYDQFLVRSSELEKGKELDPENFEASFGAASEGNRFLAQGSFSPALQRLEAAKANLDAVEKSIDDFIRQNAAKGNRAIAQGEKDVAIEAFTAILKLDPSNEDAVSKLERARVADQAFAALETAKAQEDAGSLEAAKETYAEAARIDPASAKANAGIARIERLIDERDFTQAVNAAQASLDNGNFEAAIASYQEALRVYPQRTDLEDAIAQARADKHQSDIVNLITRAYDHERAYEWTAARALYQDLLGMEPDLAEAKDGLLRTGRMIRNILRYETLIDVAATEARRDDFQQAIRTFDEAMRSKPDYLQLSDENERLRAFLQRQSQPVTVTLVSDGSTWVSIQGPTMSKPDKFENLDIQLLPGLYRIIGRKRGFRDVGIRLQVRAGMQPQVINVTPTEKTNT